MLDTSPFDDTLAYKEQLEGRRWRPPWTNDHESPYVESLQTPVKDYSNGWVSCRRIQITSQAKMALLTRANGNAKATEDQRRIG